MYIFAFFKIKTHVFLGVWSYIYITNSISLINMCVFMPPLWTYKYYLQRTGEMTQCYLHNLNMKALLQKTGLSYAVKHTEIKLVPN